MASFYSSLTHRYDMDEASGQLIDKVGSKDSTTILGAATYNEPSISLDSIDDAFHFSTANNPFIMSGDFSGGIVAELQTIENTILATLDLAGNFFQLFAADSVDWLQLNMGTGPDANNLVVGRDLALSEKFAWMFSFDFSTGELHCVAKSDHPTLPLDLSGTITVAPPSSVGGLYLGRNRTGTNYYEPTYHLMGSEIGTARSIADLQDTADDFLSPPAPPEVPEGEEGGRTPRGLLGRRGRISRGASRFI